MYYLINYYMTWFPDIYKDKHKIIKNNIFSKVYFNSSSLLSVSNIKTNIVIKQDFRKNLQ